jgi:hypothetical protein
LPVASAGTLTVACSVIGDSSLARPARGRFIRCG